MSTLEALFNPLSVAIIGASRKEGKVGNSILKNLLKSGYVGKVYPINPKTEEVLGLKCYPSVLKVSENIDLGVVSVPSKKVPQIAEECGKKGIKILIVISAGFREIGREGVILEKRLMEICKEYNIRMLGPNCLGIMDTFTPLNVSFVNQTPLKGKIAFLSQSGALCSSVLDWSLTERVGFSKFISLGNKADLDETDLMLFLAEDEATKVILIYLEGLKNGDKFIEVAQQVTRKKPVAILKSGITDAGARAASSHTGSIVGNDLAFNLAFKKTGIIRVETTEELFDISETLSTQPIPKGSNLAIVTNAGGPGILATDACEKHGLNMAPISSKINKELRKKLPLAASFYNPIDLLGDATAERYRFALETVMKSTTIHNLLTILTPQAMTEPMKTAKVLVEIAKRFPDKPIVTSFIGGEMVTEAVRFLEESGIPNYPFPERAIKSLHSLIKYSEYLMTPSLEIVPKFDVDFKKASWIIKNVRNENRVTLTASESTEVLRAYGVLAPSIGLAKTAEEAVSIAEGKGYPVAMKIESPQILHKTDIGGVKLNIESNDEVRKSFYEIIGRAHTFAPKSVLSGVNVHKMVLQGREMIIGVHRDLTFGPLIMFGLGGIYVNLLQDVSFRLAPLTKEDALKMIKETKAYTLLRGIRGETASDINSIVSTLLRISQLVTDFSEIEEMDINPLFVYKSGKGCIALDVKIMISSSRGNKY